MVTAPLGLMVCAWLTASPELERAEALFSQFKYAEARAVLARAKASGRLERPVLLRALELSGVAAGHLRQGAAAEAVFRELLVLDPNYQLGAEYAPRVTTPFLAARGWVAANGALVVEPEVALGPGQVERLGLRVRSDPLGQARRARLHLADGASWRVEEAAVVEGLASWEVGLPEARWWAELLGEAGTQLALVGGPEALRTDAGPVPVALPPPPPDVSQVALAPRVSSPVRTASYFVAGAGVVAAGVGAFFGWRSSSDFRRVETAATDASGRVTGLTETQAFELLQSGRQAATLANLLFVSAGALGLTGVLMWALGGDAQVQVQPGPGGVAVAGRF